MDIDGMDIDGTRSDELAAGAEGSSTKVRAAATATVVSPTVEAAHAETPTVQPWLRRAWAAIRVPFWISSSRIVIGMVFAHLVITLFPQSLQHLGSGTLNNGTWFGSFDRWDSAYYTGIAAHGYPASQNPITAFFPGYPILVFLIHGASVGAMSYLDAAMVVSWLALIGATILLYRLVVRHVDQRSALAASVLLCWFPSSLFFIAPYSEALLLFEILAVVTLLDQRRFLLASCVAACASATSPEAVTLIVAIVVAAALRRQHLAKIAGYAAIGISGLVAYGLFLQARFGSFFEFEHVQQYWHRSENAPFYGLYRNFVALSQFFQGPGPAPGGPYPTFANIKYVWLLNDAAMIVAAVLTLYLLVVAAQPVVASVVRRRGGTILSSQPFSVPSSFVVVAVGIVLIAACTTIYPYGDSHFYSTEGEARFVSTCFPMYVAGGYLATKRFGVLAWVLAASIVFAILFQGLYNLGYWVT
jgi:Mannosyltransferase (PIG-V)